MSVNIVALEEYRFVQAPKPSKLTKKCGWTGGWNSYATSAISSDCQLDYKHGRHISLDAALLNIDETGTDATKEERVRVHEATPAGVTITALKGVVGTERRDDASSLPWWRVMHDLQDCTRSADDGGDPMFSASRDKLPLSY